jgi:hypothetical protein
MFCIEPRRDVLYNIAMPSSTDAEIEAIIAKIRSLCARPFSVEAEGELRKLALELRTIIAQHVEMAKSSLGIIGAAINEHDPAGHDPDAEPQ